MLFSTMKMGSLFCFFLIFLYKHEIFISWVLFFKTTDNKSEFLFSSLKDFLLEVFMFFRTVGLIIGSLRR